MAELRKDPAFVAREAQKADEIRRNAARYKAAASGVLAELAGLGYELGAIGDLRRLGTPYPDAVPVLVRWMSLVDYTPLKEDIVRTLSVPWAHDAAEALVAEFERVDDPTNMGVRWAIGNALEVLAAETIAEEMIRLAADLRYGKARQMVVLGLGKLKGARVVNALMSLLGDEAVEGHAVMSLGKLRAKEARPRLETLLHHPQTWLRKEAKKALARIAKGR
jgi:hypothetical protein